MSPTGKAGKPRNKPPALNGKTQFQRFVETAKALEVDESGKAFERALGVVLIKPAATLVRSSSKTPSQ
jgi:hypothetical protein